MLVEFFELLLKRFMTPHSLKKNSSIKPATFMLYSNTISFQHYQGITIILQLRLLLLTVYYEVSTKEICQFALNSLKNEEKEKSISDLRVMALPQYVVAQGLSTSMKTRMTSLDSSITRVNVIIFILSLNGTMRKTIQKSNNTEMKIK